MHGNITILTAPAAEPITVDEFKELAREGSADFDGTVIPLHIAEAREQILDLVSVAAVNQTFRLTLDDFPHCEQIEIEMTPLVSVESIDYVDTDGASQTLVEDTDFRVVTATTPGKVILMPDKSWPATQQRREVTIDFTAGYGADASNVPAKYKLAVAELAKERYHDWPTMSDKTKMMIDALRWRVMYV